MLSEPLLESMKIKLYLEHYRTRHGSSGCVFHYTETDRALSVLNTYKDGLEPEEVEEIEAMIAAGDPKGALSLLWDFDDGSSGHETDMEDVVVDVSKAEVVP